jgi:hypothetical protein
MIFDPDGPDNPPNCDNDPNNGDEDSIVRHLAPLLPPICVAAVKRPYMARCGRMCDAERFANQGQFMWILGHIRCHYDQLPWTCVAASLRRQLIPNSLIAEIEKAFHIPGSQAKRGCGPLGSLIREHHLYDQVDRPWNKKFDQTPIVRFRNEVLVTCGTVKAARRIRRELQMLIAQSEVPQRIKPRLAIRLIDDDPATFAGMRVEFGPLQLEWRLGRRAWSKLDRLLHRAKAGSEPYRLACRAVAGWILLAGPAYLLTNMNVALPRIEAAMARAGFEPLPDRDVLNEFWKYAYTQWSEIRRQHIPKSDSI